MAVTRLADVVVPEVFAPYMMKATKERSVFFQSGIFRNDPSFQAFLAGGGSTVNVPFWKDLDNTEANVASDDPTSDATPLKITAGQDIGCRQVKTQGWSTADLTAELAGSDPMQAITDRVAAYWERFYERTLVSTLQGVYADNVANDSGDMVNDVGTDAVGTPTADELFNADAFIDAEATMSDVRSELSLFVVHPIVMTRMKKNNLIDFIPDARGEVNIPNYQGYRVVESRNAKTITGTNRTKYVSYLIGNDALCWSDHPPATPVEIDRDASQADGMGVEELWTRHQFLMHPYGVAYQASGVSGSFPTLAELEAAARWDRVYTEREQVPIAFLLTNG